MHQPILRVLGLVRDNSDEDAHDVLVEDVNYHLLIVKDDVTQDPETALHGGLSRFRFDQLEDFF